MLPERQTVIGAANQAKNNPATVREAVAGCIEVLDETRVAGWAFGRDRPETPVDIEIRLENEVVQRARAEISAGPGASRYWQRQARVQRRLR